MKLTRYGEFANERLENISDIYIKRVFRAVELAYSMMIGV